MKKVTAIIIIFLLLFLIRGIFLSIQDLISSNNEAENLSQSLTKKEQEHEFLRQKLSYVKSNEYIEDQARNKLGLVQPGEHIVLVPSPVMPQKQENNIDEEPNWKKWVVIFK